MKRIFTLLLVMVAVTVNAQSIKLFYNNEPMNDGDTVFVPIDPHDDAAVVYLAYQNMTSTPIEFRVRKEVLYMGDEADLLFCVGECYTGNLSAPMTLAANEMMPENGLLSFHASYSGSTDPALVRFTFFLTDNESDKVTCYVCFGSGVGIRPADLVKNLRAYPNPAHNLVSVDYVAPVNGSYLVVKNLTGKEVYRTELTSITGKKQIDVSKFNAGVYFYGVESEGKMLCTKKLLIK